MIGFPDSRPLPPPPIRVQAPGRQDFTIPLPQGAKARPEIGQPSVERPATNPFSALTQGATSPELVLGAAALVLLAIVFLFVRQGVRVHLINRRATLDAADGAAWMLFAALMVTAFILVGATVGRLWQAWAGLTAGFALCVVLFAIALALVLRAPDRRR